MASNINFSQNSQQSNGQHVNELSEENKLSPSPSPSTGIFANNSSQGSTVITPKSTQQYLSNLTPDRSLISSPDTSYDSMTDFINDESTELSQYSDVEEEDDDDDDESSMDDDDDDEEDDFLNNLMIFLGNRTFNIDHCLPTYWL